MNLSFGLKGPCLNCEDRVVGCHSSCPLYLDFKKAVEEKRQIELEHKNSVANDYQRDKRTKMYKKVRNKSKWNLSCWKQSQ